MVGPVAKSKVDELEDEVRELLFSRHIRKELTGVVQGVSGKRSFLVRFQDECEKYLTSNQITIVTVDNRPVTEEDEVANIYVIPDEDIDL